MRKLDNNILKSIVNVIKKHKSYVNKISKKHKISTKIWKKLISSKFRKNLKDSIKNITNNKDLRKMFKSIYSDKKLKTSNDKNKAVFYIILQIIKKNMK